jgi:hypothetical protein
MLLFCAATANADTFTASFDSLASGTSATGGIGPSGSIQNYLLSLLPAGKTVSVSSGAVTDQDYNGDDHVVGPCSPANCGPGATVSSVTLGPDTFVRNLSSATFFSFSFTGLLIDSVSFDYEIFPDGTCTELKSSKCGGSATGGIYPNQPDFTFSTNLGQIFHFYGLTPTLPGYTHSPDSGRNGDEKTPQLIGSGTWNTNGASTLTFTDWPATIGIDNLVVNYYVPGVPQEVLSTPEPGTVLLLGTVIAGLFGFRRRFA